MSIQEGKMRIGWTNIPLVEIYRNDWVAIFQNYAGTYKSKNAASMDINALRTIVESTLDDIWVTFYDSRLWWGKLADGNVQADTISNYRILDGDWNKYDSNGNELLANQIPGNIAKVQGFKGTVCRISEIDDLKRLINNIPSDEYKNIVRTRDALIREIELGLKKLHWKEFETLVDMIFENAGWQRLSMVGGSMKYTDIELQEPITHELYQVQVKSQASYADFEKYAQKFTPGKFKKLYFVVHSPDKKLAENGVGKFQDVELVFANELARMVVERGFTDWLLMKIR